VYAQIHSGVRYVTIGSRLPGQRQAAAYSDGPRWSVATDLGHEIDASTVPFHGTSTIISLTILSLSPHHPGTAVS